MTFQEFVSANIPNTFKKENANNWVFEYEYDKAQDDYMDEMVIRNIAVTALSNGINIRLVETTEWNEVHDELESRSEEQFSSDEELFNKTFNSYDELMEETEGWDDTPEAAFRRILEWVKNGEYL